MEEKIKKLSQKFNEKENVIREMIKVSLDFGYDIEETIGEIQYFYTLKSNAISNAIGENFNNIK